MQALPLDRGRPHARRRRRWQRRRRRRRAQQAPWRGALRGCRRACRPPPRRQLRQARGLTGSQRPAQARSLRLPLTQLHAPAWGWRPWPARAPRAAAAGWPRPARRRVRPPAAPRAWVGRRGRRCCATRMPDLAWRLLSQRRARWTARARGRARALRLQPARPPAAPRAWLVRRGRRCCATKTPSLAWRLLLQRRAVWMARAWGWARAPCLWRAPGS